MRILVDLIHPAHVHFFRNAIDEFESRGHEVAVTAREKDVTIELLERFGISFTKLSRAGVGRGGLFYELISRDIKLLKFCRRFKPDVLTGISGVFAAHAGFLLRRPSVVWDDTEHQKLAHMITYPFASYVYSPDCYMKSMGRKHHLYAGVHELAYLHPNRFTPDAELVRSLGIEPDEKYCIIRFVSWQAHHDVGQHGFAAGERMRFVEEIAKHARPYISCEGELPAEFEPYRLDVPVHQIHQVMAFASLCVGEGATMISESAVLGVPAVYINTLKLGYINMLEGYGLVRQTTDTEEALGYCVDLLGDSGTSERCADSRRRLLDDKIDVTDFIVGMVEQAGR